MKPLRSQSGLTLLELLVAVAVVAIMGTMAFQGLNSVVEHTRVLEQEREAFRRLHLTLSLLESDVRHALARGSRDELGDREGPLSGSSQGFTLTRGGFMSAREEGQLARIGYQWTDEGLIRLRWPVLDRTQASDPIVQTLLTDIERMDVEYLGRGDDWSRSWPPGEQARIDSTAWPRALRVMFESQQHGHIERIFTLPQSAGTSGASAP